MDKENLNMACRRLKANKGVPGIDGIIVEDALCWLREQREELLESIRSEKYNLEDVQALLKGLFKRTIEQMLEAEIDEHLGCEKHSIIGNNSRNRLLFMRKTLK